MPVYLRPRRIVGQLWVGLLASAFTTFALADTPLNDVQKAATAWAQLRAETSRLEKTWDSEREMLAASLSGLGAQADQLAAERETVDAQTATAREEIASLTATNQATAQRIAAAGDRIHTLSQQLIALRPALPPRLSAALELPYRTIADPNLAPAERMRHTMAILNRCNQFNQTFVLSEEILPVTPGGEPRLLEVIYWGLAQGCALDRSAGEAFLGRAVNGTWTWEAQPKLTRAVTQLIDIHQDKVAPAFVTVPAQVIGGAQ